MKTPTIEQLAAYLPYDARVKHLQHEYCLDGHMIHDWVENPMFYGDYKLLLTPMAEMEQSTVEECGFNSFTDLKWSVVNGELSVKKFNLLLSKHMDLFGLIESGTAIPK